MMQHKAVFEFFQKLYLQIYASQFMTPQIILLPFVLLYLESVARKGEIEYLENKKSFLDEVKSTFHSF